MTFLVGDIHKLSENVIPIYKNNYSKSRLASAYSLQDFFWYALYIDIKILKYVAARYTFICLLKEQTNGRLWMIDDV